MPSHKPGERRKRRREEARREASRTPVQERLGLSGIDPRSAAKGGRPIVTKGDVPVPVKEAPPKLLETRPTEIGRQQEELLAEQAVLKQQAPALLEERGAFEVVRRRAADLADKQHFGERGAT